MRKALGWGVHRIGCVQGPASHLPSLPLPPRPPPPFPALPSLPFPPFLTSPTLPSSTPQHLFGPKARTAPSGGVELRDDDDDAAALSGGRRTSVDSFHSHDEPS